MMGTVMRRAVGVAVLVLALLAVVVAARVDGTRIAGRAIAPPGLTAPDVGDCVRSFADPADAAPALDTTSDAAVPADSTAPRPLPEVGVVEESAVAFTNCAGEHLGEVVAYRRMPQQRKTDADRAADVDWCRSVAGDYRAHLQWQVSDAAGGVWQPSTGQRFTAVLSAPFIDPQEPRWATCLVLPPAGESYRGSYLKSLAGGPAPAPFGRCLIGAPAERPASCTEPHTAQEFGTTFGRFAGGPNNGAARCRELIGAMTGMRDPTAGGRLRMELATNASGAASCRLLVVRDHLLTGSLIGIGNEPLPLT